MGLGFNWVDLDNGLNLVWVLTFGLSKAQFSHIQPTKYIRVLEPIQQRPSTASTHDAHSLELHQKRTKTKPLTQRTSISAHNNDQSTWLRWRRVTNKRKSNGQGLFSQMTMTMRGLRGRSESWNDEENDDVGGVEHRQMERLRQSVIEKGKRWGGGRWKNFGNK